MAASHVLPSAAQAVVHGLMVEANGIARKVLEQVLAQGLMQRVDVRWIRSPRDFRRETTPTLPAIALVDLDHAPDEACALLASLPASCLKIATSLYEDEERLLPALKCDLHGYLLKQDRLEQQIEHLQKIVRGAPVMSPILARALLDLPPCELKWLETRDTAMLEQVARGLGPREIARHHGLNLAEQDAAISRVYQAMGRQPCKRPSRAIESRT